MTQINKEYFSLCRIVTLRGSKVHNAYYDLENGHARTYCGKQGFLNSDFEKVNTYATCQYCSDHDNDYELAKEEA